MVADSITEFNLKLMDLSWLMYQSTLSPIIPQATLEDSHIFISSGVGVLPICHCLGVGVLNQRNVLQFFVVVFLCQILSFFKRNQQQPTKHEFL